MANQPSEYSRIEDVIANLAEAGKKKQRGKAAISAAAAVGSAIGQSVGEGRGVQPVSPTTGTGIASPLTEASYADRTFYADEILTTTDGMFSFLLRRTKALTLTDANGAEVVISLADKP